MGMAMVIMGMVVVVVGMMLVVVCHISTPSRYVLRVTISGIY